MQSTAVRARAMELAQFGVGIPDIVFGLKILAALTTVTPSQRNVGMRYRE